MNIDDKKSFQSFTNHLIDDFQDYLPFTTLCKLHVIDCHLQDMTNNDITNSLANFAEKINAITINGTGELVFIIGSSCGIAPTVSNRADFRLSLSKMTFLHQFARLLLIEQIYRAFKILKNETYHK